MSYPILIVVQEKMLAQLTLSHGGHAIMPRNVAHKIQKLEELPFVHNARI
jgi:hypothetical protein